MSHPPNHSGGSLPPPLPFASSRSGFTLIELMVTMVILAIGITAGMRAINASTDASAAARDRITAATLAQQVMNEILHTQELTTGSDSGDFGDEFPRFRWESLVESSQEVTNLDEATELLVARVIVYWSGGLTERQFELATLYLPPLTLTGATGSVTTGGSQAGGQGQ